MLKFTEKKVYVYHMFDKSQTALTSRQIKHMLPAFVKKIGRKYQKRPDLIIAAWPEIIGPRFSSMAQAVSYCDGFLNIKVKNSSLLSLLVQHESKRLLKELRQRFPNAKIRNIQFYIG